MVSARRGERSLPTRGVFIGGEMARQYLVNEEHLLTLLALAEWELKVMPRGDEAFRQLHRDVLSAIREINITMGVTSYAAHPFHLPGSGTYSGGGLPQPVPP